MNDEAINRSRVLRLLRIGASVVCLLLCVTFVLLWVRSFAWFDSFAGPLPRLYMFEASTRHGRLEVLASGPAFRLKLWEVSSYPVPVSPAPQTVSARPLPRFNYKYGQGRLLVTMPLWFPIVVSGALAALLGIRTYRFSLRGLLIVTTIVALILGMVVAMRE